MSESGGEAFWLWAESGSDGKAYGAMNTVRELWGGILGDGQGHSNGEAYGAMDKVRQ